MAGEEVLEPQPRFWRPVLYQLSYTPIRAVHAATRARTQERPFLLSDKCKLSPMINVDVSRTTTAEPVRVKLAVRKNFDLVPGVADLNDARFDDRPWRSTSDSTAGL
jgi:hypothetical protein